MAKRGCRSTFDVVTAPLVPEKQTRVAHEEELFMGIDVCKNSCMLYWKDDVDLEYRKLCEDGMYKATRERDLGRKKSPYVVLRYLPLTLHLQRLYVLRAIAEDMTWHAIHQKKEGSMRHLTDAEPWKHFDRNVLLGLCVGGLRRIGSTVVLIHVGPLSLHRTISPGYVHEF
ncbi:UNVERIFIED_CONTAM: hypothetical protein Sradi_6224000 [Sesamum radiatum]|uniref:Uncharacterized protein n=1 Tax=Sesamum radiatum TaxID=300843 RepID=A0AAW2KA45_SESRA